MRPLDALSRAVDRSIEVFSPRWAAKRALARRGLRQYAAAKTSLSTGAWVTASENVNTLLSSSLPALRSRARQLVRDMPAMATALTRLTQFTVGDGLSLQSMVQDASGKLDKTLNRKIEDAWRYWCDDCDRGKRLHYHEVQQLCARQETEVGEYVVVKYASRSDSYLPFQLMILEPDQLTGYGATVLPGNEILEGVEYDPRSGRAVAYHFDDPARFKRPLRIPADQVLVGFETLRPGQLRGVTPLAPAILLAHALRDFLEAELDSARMAARYLAFVTSEDPSSTLTAFGGALSSTYKTSSGGEKYVMEYGNAIVDFLKTGESVTLAQHNRPGNSFEPFVKWAVATFAATVGTTYELLSGDYSAAAYTGARVARNDMLAGIRVRRGRLLRQLNEPVRREFLKWAVLTGKLDLPRYFTAPEAFQRCVWVNPGMESLDPLREGRAEAEAVDKLLRSPQEVLGARGRDAEAVLDERKEWEDMLAERGLSALTAPKSLQTNPASVAPGTGSGNGAKADPDSPLWRVK